MARGATRRPGQAVGARGRALRLGPEPRPCCQGAGDTAVPVEAAVGPAQATLDDAADARGTADETRRRARSVPYRLALGRGRHRQRYVQLSPQSRQAAASSLARRPISVAHQPRRGRPGQAVEPLSAAGCGRGGVQEPQEPAPAKAGGDLAIRPVFHQLEASVEAHVFIAFLAYCLHVTLARPLRALLLTRYTDPEPELSLLLTKLKLELPVQPPPKITAESVPLIPL